MAAKQGQQLGQQIVPMKVSIFGREYPVACPAGEENALLHSAQFVDDEMHKVRKSGKVVGTDRIAMMVSLNLAHELLVTRHHQEHGTHAGSSDTPDTDTETLQRIDAMNTLIDGKLEKFQRYLPAAE